MARLCGPDGPVTRVDKWGRLSQNRRMLETEEMRIFAAIVAVSSVSRAARELEVPRATVSRKLALLEERLGARLLRRTTRSMQLTDAGKAFHRAALAALDAVVVAEASVAPRGASPAGDVFISM